MLFLLKIKPVKKAPTFQEITKIRDLKKQQKTQLKKESRWTGIQAEKKKIYEEWNPDRALNEEFKDERSKLLTCLTVGLWLKADLKENYFFDDDRFIEKLVKSK